MSNSREKVMQMAEKYVARGKLDQAIKEYRKLLRYNPNDASTLNRVGDLYARQSNVGEAVRLFLQIAENYSKDGFLVKAIAIYKKIIRLDPTQLKVYSELADLYHRQGLTNEARVQFQVVADYYLKHGDRSQAIDVHRKMAEIEPNNPSHRVKLAELYQQEGLIEETIGEYQRIAEVMLEHGKVEEATKVYLRALDLDAQDLAFVSEAVLRLREGGHQ
jgi:tetratricopeptide (TPR) repeat protein